MAGARWLSGACTCHKPGISPFLLSTQNDTWHLLGLSEGLVLNKSVSLWMSDYFRINPAVLLISFLESKGFWFWDIDPWNQMDMDLPLGRGLLRYASVTNYPLRDECAKSW